MGTSGKSIAARPKRILIGIIKAIVLEMEGTMRWHGCALLP
jgi:hypothetical protein